MLTGRLLLLLPALDLGQGVGIQANHLQVHGFKECARALLTPADSPFTEMLPANARGGCVQEYQGPSRGS